MKNKADIQIGKRASAELMERYDFRATVAADAVGCGKHHVYEWARGVTPGPIFLQRMALMGLDVHYILTGQRRHP